ncbi:C40 family peptidase [Geobacter pickeringii]|uniref:Peptidoglycan-binding protein LysM n=1 Tax=Geobacter pickeringii TaxID=345632 RepID=A0A0B5BHK9_9BACT|nr:C40 family peptidase [Geobacter pickeringii]AJE03960.1 peptidoglycan-binding protein LysM [Geobacter pickeringii]
MNIRLRLAALTVFLLVFPSLSFAAKTHKVRKNETVTSIARKYHVSAGELKAANNLAKNRVSPGTVLVIPPRTAADTSSDAPKTSASTYKVKKGDTLAKVARKTGVAEGELRRLNALRKNRLKPGQFLVLKEADPTPAAEPAPKLSLKKPLRNGELFSEKEYEQSLAELMDGDPDRPADFTKGVTLQVDGITELKKSAYSFIGTRYRFGGTTRRGLDCSSFVQHVFRELDVTLPRTAREQFQMGNAVATGDLQKGDLLFFHTYARFASHVGIYLGNNKMIHASSRDRRVVISSIDTPYYRSRFLGAKRIARVNPDTLRLDDLTAGVEEEGVEDILMNDTLGVSLLK